MSFAKLKLVLLNKNTIKRNCSNPQEILYHVVVLIKYRMAIQEVIKIRKYGKCWITFERNKDKLVVKIVCAIAKGIIELILNVVCFALV